MNIIIINMVFTLAIGVTALPVINSQVHPQVRDTADKDGTDGDWVLLKKASISGTEF
ncbi:uncharacterized protein F4807DRAFT_465393 [Annulohypoxylon truncatum]|uniref:uncharacterized protein n=1 Tax=Annulohypoxylon truncatum TaxID=327061 RepID=UPI002007C083|nr:uncharacterized protein F4807DRAFT_465393 [Annulohypoxylon truncatum]KAI1204755.1 hypothetical protein F4807DRAFT_465393 [Annulohypoxylon truncatum]